MEINMTGIIFSLLVIFEIAFTSYCIYTASAHVKVRCYARLLELAIFIILCILTILEWGMRWYLLGILLLALAIKELYVLALSKKEAKQFRKRNLILKTIGMVLLFTVVLIPAFLFPQYEAPQRTGEYDVATAQYTYTSDTITDYYTGGNRQVNVEFWYPKNAEGKYPLVVFSHGAFGIKNSNKSAFEELSSHGYVVCSIDHPGHSFYTRSEDGQTVLVDQGYMKEVTYSNEDAYYTKEETSDLIQKWMRVRVDDINFTIDTILQSVTQVDQSIKEVVGNSNITQSQQEDTTKLFQLIDVDSIGVFGHSMGAAASVQIGRERKDVDAVINIDGPYFSEMVYDANVDEFVATSEQYDIPILNIYSDQVWVQLQDGTDTGVYAGNKISDQICTESYDVYLKGTKHLTLTDLAIVSPFLTYLLNGQGAKVDAKESIELENSLILEFFDAALKGKGEFTSAGVYE
jgi:dienelactone hydrolase